MRNKLLLSLAISFSWISVKAQNCDINATATPSTITCGQTTVLTTFGSSAGQVVLDEDFNSGGFGPGWGSTPGATSFNNPCSPGGVDGTPHAWMDNNTSVPRTLTSAPYDLTAATAGVSVCFDLLFAEQGDAAPCEGPDEPDEGVYLQYSTDGGNTWIDIHYFDPNGGNDPQLTNWNNWCFELPPGAITSNTQIRWHQTADSGADYDHWGIDNVQIFQNDINAEVEWLHDGYSYGVGNPGGDNPTPVSPTSTTTYTAQITTGTGDVCTADVTVIVVDPIYDVNVSANPTTVCVGDCADITGTAQIILDPGGIETYENNQTEIVATGSASVNINIQTLNMTGVNPGSIQEICINGFNFSGTEACTNISGCNCNGTPINFLEQCNIDASSFNITVTSPNGCEITLVPANTIVTTGVQDMCFVPSGGAPISSGSGNYTGQFDPTDPISNLDGCDANGVWTLEFNTGTGGLGFGFGSLTGWNITFDDPPVYAPVDISWSPTTGLSNPSSINTQACPTNSTDYELTVSTGTPGCEVHTETVSIIVDPCGGCIPPNVIVNPLDACAPANLDLTSAIGAGSDPATITYHGNQTDAQNDVNTVGTSVSSSGSYWVRYEDPSDPTCFGVREIVVTISTPADASFTLTDFCEGTANSASNIATPGGTFSFNPVPGGGVTIDPSTGEITNGVTGTQYTVEYSISSGCPSSSTENVTINANPTPVITGALQYCIGSSTTLSTTSTYSDYLWTTGSTNQSTTATTADNPNITVTVTDANGCTGTSAPVNLIESTEIVFDDQIEICQGESVSIHGVTQSTPGVYSTTLPSASGCDSISNITLVVNPLPTPVITGDLFYCPGETTILDAGGPFSSYDWSIGGNQQTVNATTGTGITVTVTDANGCSATSAPVTVVPPVNAAVTATPNSGGDPLDVVLSNGSTNASNYYWDFGNGNVLNTNNLDSQNQTYTGEDSFTVMLVAEENGCTDTAYVTISLNNPMVIDIPNVFTPNGDLANDVFFFNSLGVATLEITILNRWGNLVFESDDVNFFWNGKTASGQDAKEGVYFFKYQATGFDGTSQEGHGFVTLER